MNVKLGYKVTRRSDEETIATHPVYRAIASIN